MNKKLSRKQAVVVLGVLGVVLGILFLPKALYAAVPRYRGSKLNKEYTGIKVPISGLQGYDCSGGDILDNRVVSCGYTYKISPSNRCDEYYLILRFFDGPGPNLAARNTPAGDCRNLTVQKGNMTLTFSFGANLNSAGNVPIDTVNVKVEKAW